MKREKKSEFVKLVGKHVEGCCALKNERSGYWDTCWGPTFYGDHGEPIVTTERRYGKNGRVFRTWLRYMCNETNCSAELHIETHYIVRQLAALKKGKP